MAELRRLGHVYESDGAVWLRTTDFGDDKDRVLIRENGEPTYFTADISYHRDKVRRGAELMITPVGADHHGYVPRMIAGLEAIGVERGRYEAPIMQLVNVVEGGQRARMSKRKGDFVTLDALIDDIGVDAARFFMVQRGHDTAFDLDLDLARSASQDNPVYYVQYAHARIAGILRKATEQGGSEGQAAVTDAALEDEALAAAAEASERASGTSPARASGGDRDRDRAARPASPVRFRDGDRGRFPRLLSRLPRGRRAGAGHGGGAPGALPGHGADDRDDPRVAWSRRSRADVSRDHGEASAVSVVIAARNAERTLGATLSGLASQDFPGAFEVIVVDDGSTDATRRIAEASELEPALVAGGGLGPGPARNLGVAAAAGEAIAFIDADCVPDRGWLAAGVEALAGAELVQGLVRADSEVACGPFDRTLWVTSETGLYECASLFVTRELFERIGGFEDWLEVRIGKPLAEDTWLGWRARRSGARTSFSEGAAVTHAVFGRGVAGLLSERLRCGYFPAIVGKMPELRGTLLFGGLFLTRRTAGFDLALGAAVIAATRRSPLALIAVTPWLVALARSARRWGRRAPEVAAVEALADVVAFSALVAGSIRFRCVVL